MLNEVGKRVASSYVWRQNSGYSFGRSVVQGHDQCLPSSVCVTTNEPVSVCGCVRCSPACR